MALNWGVGDVLTVSKLAWDLYHDVVLVAREAPEEFRKLIDELASLQGVLRTLRDDVSSDQSFLDNLGKSKKQMLERCLGESSGTLQQLKQLVEKYRLLGQGDSSSFWQKIKWVSERGNVSALKAKLMVHTCNLNLCMTTIASSSLVRIEASMAKALKRQEAARDLPDEYEDMEPLARAQSPSSGSLDGERLGIRSLTREFTETTLVDRARSPESAAVTSEEDTSDYVVSHRSQTLGSGARRTSNLASDRESKFSPPSPSVSDRSIKDGQNTSPENPSKPRSRISLQERETSNVFEAVAEAKKELSKIRRRDQSKRPLRIPPQDSAHVPDEKVKAKFEKLANAELQVRRLNVKDWLRVGTWWLLKAGHNMQCLERPRRGSVRGSIGPSSISPSSDSRSNQGYVDLLKSSFILHEIILKDDIPISLLTNENRALLHNLSDGIQEVLSLFRAVDVPDSETILRQNLNIWETLQPEEDTISEDDLIPVLENNRWLTVEMNDAGAEDEKVLFRTFVNAAIGVKAHRMWSRGAPYLLLLSTKEGESEPKVTICNQSGTLGLTRDFTADDLREADIPTSPLSDMSRIDLESIPLSFEQLNLEIAFTNDEDYHRFNQIPSTYFDAVKRREPRQLSKATETLLFKRSLEVCEQIKASTMKPTNPRQRWRSCGLRVLETTTGEGWRTTRRLVLHSSANEKRPWCKELFLPLSRVQISRDTLERQIVLKWSDCSQEGPEKTDGQYHKIWSFLYDDTNPNLAFNLLFRNQQDARDFENVVLRLSLPIEYVNTTDSDFRCVYTISDTVPVPKRYKALMISRTSHGWKYSDLFYMYGDSDYQYDHSHERVRLPQVYYATYISTHVDRLHEPPPDQPPRFSHCEKKVGNLTIDFSDEFDGHGFMSALTLDHQLLFSRRAMWISTSPPPRFGSARSNKGSAEVQLWRSGNMIRLVSRHEDKVDNKFITIAVPKQGLVHPRENNLCKIPKLEIDRGTQINMSKMVATNARNSSEARKVGPVTIAFESPPDREEFIAALEGRRPLSPRNPFEDLMSL